MSPHKRTRRTKSLISGAVSKTPWQGGLAWMVMQYAVGLRRLGYDVIFVEQLHRSDLRPEGSRLEASENAAYFREVVQQFGLGDRAALLLSETQEIVGLPYDRILGELQQAEVLINLGGDLADPELLAHVPVRLYLDLDPGFTQLWHLVEGIDMRFHGHTHFATVGLTLGRPECPVPTCDIDWIPTLQPVVLEEWPYANGIERDALTTIANWRGYGSVEANGVFYGQKAHSLRRLIDVPRRVDERFDLALAIDPGEPRDLAALGENGWNVIDPLTVAGTPDQYRDFIQGSRGEFGIAKSGYVEARCGWFSDRSVCYLASGRPVIAQDTGFKSVLPTGEGLFSFQTVEDIEDAVDALSSDYERHRKAARDIAEEYFVSDVVLSRLLSKVGIAA